MILPLNLPTAFLQLSRAFRERFVFVLSADFKLQTILFKHLQVLRTLHLTVLHLPSQRGN